MEDYNFWWSDYTIYQLEDVPSFTCETTEGRIERGKQSSVSFTFFAQDIGTFESFWSFKIDKYEAETLFLLVAHVTNPEVYCLPVHLQLKPTVLGIMKILLIKYA